MKKKLLLKLLAFSLTFPLLLNPTKAMANYGDYLDGYDDGYDDAMDDCPCPPPSLWLSSGFYLGAGVGYEGFQIERNPWVMDDRIGHLNTHANGWNGRLFGGYGHYFDKFYLGGEAFIGTSDANGSDFIRTSSFKYHGDFSANTSYGLSVLPGYRFNQDGPLFYGRAGFIQTQLWVSDKSFKMGGNTCQWTNAYNLGLGVQVPVYKDLSFRLGYDYINYSSFTNSGGTGSNNSPVDNRGSLDLVYHIPY